MPESPEVTLFKNQLNNLLAGGSLLSIDIVGGKFLKTGIEGWHKDLFPLHNTLIHNSGKFLYWSFHNDTLFYSTLGMSGSYGALNKHSALKFNFSDNEIYYNDIRRFGNFKIINKAELKEKLDSLGWDPFSLPEIPNWLIPIVRIKNKKTIAEVLMDQSIFNGIGNYLKNEILYASHIHPNTIVSSLSDEQIIELAGHFKRIANEALAVGGATIATYSDIYGIAGSFFKQFKVYNQKQDPEGNPVIKIQTKDKRSSYYVEKYQKL